MSVETQLFAQVYRELDTRLTTIEHGMSILLQRTHKMVTDLDGFIADMTAKMEAEEADIAGLKTFIAGLFAQINTIPGLSDAQKASLEAIEAKVDTDAKTILDAMVPPIPPAAA